MHEAAAHAAESELGSVGFTWELRSDQPVETAFPLQHWRKVQCCTSEKRLLTAENLSRDSVSLEVSVKYKSTSALASLLLSAQNDGSKCGILAIPAIRGTES